jgi:hypothetical protein
MILLAFVCWSTDWEVLSRARRVEAIEIFWDLLLSIEVPAPLHWWTCLPFASQMQTFHRPVMISHIMNSVNFLDDGGLYLCCVCEIKIRGVLLDVILWYSVIASFCRSQPLASHTEKFSDWYRRSCKTLQVFPVGKTGILFGNEFSKACVFVIFLYWVLLWSMS